MTCSSAPSIRASGVGGLGDTADRSRRRHALWRARQRPAHRQYRRRHALWRRWRRRHLGRAEPVRQQQHTRASPSRHALRRRRRRSLRPGRQGHGVLSQRHHLDSSSNRAIIKDFNASDGDRIQLVGAAGDYVVQIDGTTAKIYYDEKLDRRADRRDRERCQASTSRPTTSRTSRRATRSRHRRLRRRRSPRRCPSPRPELRDPRRRLGHADQRPRHAAQYAARHRGDRSQHDRRHAERRGPCLRHLRRRSLRPRRGDHSQHRPGGGG